MKHTLPVTVIVVFMFILAQFIGLFAISSYIDPSYDDGLKPLPASIERPDVEESFTPWLMIIGVFIGTLIILLLVKFKANKAWSIWFGLSMLLLSFIALSAFMSDLYAFVIAIIFAYLKVTSRNISWMLRNIPELFIYSGLAIIFAPLLNVWGAVILLLLISVYDMYAVWQSKHMVKLAKFQLNSGKFAGFSVAYYASSNSVEDKKEVKSKVETKKKVSKIMTKDKKENNEINYDSPKKKTAILGGGDVAFPLLFSSTLLLSSGWLLAIGATLGATVGLTTLLYLSVKDRFYPAMPFISAGCFLGVGIFYFVLMPF